MPPIGTIIVLALLILVIVVVLVRCIRIVQQSKDYLERRPALQDAFHRAHCQGRFA